MAATAFFVRLTVSVSVLQEVIKIKRLRYGNYSKVTVFVGNATAAVSSVNSGISP